MCSISRASAVARSPAASRRAAAPAGTPSGTGPPSGEPGVELRRVVRRGGGGCVRATAAAAFKSLAARRVSAAISRRSLICGPSVPLMLSRMAGPSAPHRVSTAFASLPSCLDMSPMHRSWCAERLSCVCMNSTSMFSSWGDGGGGGCQARSASEEVSRHREGWRLSSHSRTEAHSENGRQRTRAGRAMRWRSTYRYHRVRHGAGPMPCAPRAEDAR